jgi:SAM-dependent methyltransferase
VVAVREEYTDVRARFASHWESTHPSLETFLVSEADEDSGLRYHRLLNGRLLTGSLDEIRRWELQRITGSVLAYEPVSVMEFGCGTGRNLLAIKRQRPSVRCIGLELTAPSVKLSTMAGEFYGLPILTHLADVTKPLNMEPVDVCFSVQALEQIPDSHKVFEQMIALSRKAVVLFEPIVELYPLTVRGLAARLRAIHLDRLRGLYSWIRERDYTVTCAELLPTAQNALNPITEVHVKPN